MLNWGKGHTIVQATVREPARPPANHDQPPQQVVYALQRLLSVCAVCVELYALSLAWAMVWRIQSEVGQRMHTVGGPVVRLAGGRDGLIHSPIWPVCPFPRVRVLGGARAETSEPKKVRAGHAQGRSSP